MSPHTFVTPVPRPYLLVTDKKTEQQIMVMRKLFGLFGRSATTEHSIADELFGNLTWSERYGGWNGIMTLATGKTAKFTIESIESEESFSEATRNTFKFLSANEPLIRDKIAVSMSEFYNGTWGDGDTITPQQLAQRISLTSVYFYGEGNGELYYKADDDLFTDHTICAPINAGGEIGRPELAG